MSTEASGPGVLRRPHFLLLWVAQAVSQTAQNVVTIALLIEVGRLTQSSIHSSLVVLCFVVPSAVLGPVAGVFVDRADKRAVLILTNILRAGAVLAFTLVGPGWPLDRTVLVLYLLSVVFSTISLFFAPAEASSIPLLVSRSQLATANSMFALTLIASQVVGFSILGPLLIKLTAPQTLFMFVASLYLLCTLLVALLPPLPPDVLHGEGAGGTGRRAARAWKEMREIIAFILHRPAIAKAIADLAATTSIFLMLGTLGVGLVTQVIGLPSSDLAYIMAAGGIGLALGLVFVPRALARTDARRLTDAGLATMGASILAMAGISVISSVLFWGLDPTIRSALGLAIVTLLAGTAGVGSAFASIPAQTLLQQSTPPSLRGRLFASLFAISSALAVLPVLFTGVLADLIGLREVMALIGLMALALGAVGRYVRAGS